MLLRAIGVGEVLSALGLQRAAACAAAAACTAAGHPRSLSSSAAAAQADLNEPTGGHGRYVSSPPSGAGTIIEDTRLQPASPGSTVVLVSGGVESAALLSYFKHWDHATKLLPLFVDYGQRNRQEEQRAQAAMCAHLGLDLATVNASMVAHQLNFAGSGRRYHDPLPHRNLLLLGLAASYAADSGAANVAICLSKDDLATYSSATLPFLRGAESLFQALDPPLTLLMPLLALRKHAIVLMGQQVKAPWHLTYSCAEGGARHCGKCTPCLLRAEAFEQAGVEDPLDAGHRQQQRRRPA